MSEEILCRHQSVWEKKPILRILYTEWYEEIVSYLAKGRTLELGGGSGNLKEFSPDIICTDIVSVPWLNAVVDSQHLPFKSGTLTNLVLFDVLHHIEQVTLFLEEAVRVLKPNGRIILMEPYVSVGSWLIYKFLHPEPVDFRFDPLISQVHQPGRKPFDSNQAMATILFERSFHRFRKIFPQLERIVHRRLSFFAYPLSGGFDSPSFLPLFLVKPLLALENRVSFLGRVCAFRILVVLEKKEKQS